MYAGGQVGPGFSFWNMVGVVMLGSAMLGAYVCVLSVAAQRSGLNTVLLARFSFGEKGSKIVDSLLGFTQIGWYAWAIALPGVILADLIGPGWFIPLVIVFTLAFTWTAYIGISALAILSRVSVPTMLVLIGLSLWLATGDAGGLSDLTGIGATSDVGIALALTLIIGTFISGGTQITNWTRFCSTTKGAILAGFVAFTLGNGLFIFAGAMGALVYQEADLTRVLGIQGLLAAGLLLMLLNVWTTADRTAYAFSVAGANFFRTEKRRGIVIGGALIGIVLAISGFYNFLESYLILLGTFIPPVGAVIAADYFIKWRANVPDLDAVRLPAFNWVGIVTYFAACLVAQFSPGVPPVNGLVAGVVIYLILNKIAEKTGATPESVIRQPETRNAEPQNVHEEEPVRD
jgi:cytosine permease